MRPSPRRAQTVLLLAAALLLLPADALACAACYGKTDSALADGMNWGILSLLGFVAVVLGGVGAFFMLLAKRAAATAAAAEVAAHPVEPTQDA